MARPLVPIIPAAETEVNITGWLKGPIRKWQSAKAAALRAMGERWVRDFLPLHFEQAAYTRYGYAGRSKRYAHWKRRYLHHNRPLVFGRDPNKRSIEKPAGTTMREMVMKSVKVTATKDHVSVKMAVPYYTVVNQHLGDRLSQELIKTTQTEVDILGRHFAEKMGAQFSGGAGLVEEIAV